MAGNKPFILRLSCLLVGLALLASCGQPKPPTLAEQLDAFDRPQSPRGWATLGWWRYLNADINGAMDAFKMAPRDPLARLGWTQLAKNRLDPVAVGDTPLARGSGVVEQLASAWTRVEQSEEAPHWLTDPISELPDLKFAELRSAPPILTDASVSRADGLTFPKSRGVPVNATSVRLARWDLAHESNYQLSIRGGFLLWQDGRLIAEGRLGPGDRRLVFRGQVGSVLVAWTGDFLPTLRRLFADAYPLTERPPKLPKRRVGKDWVRHYLECSLALENGDLIRAGRLLKESPKNAAFDLLRAQWTERQSHLPRVTRLDRARALWRSARGVAPVLARFGLARAERRLLRLESALNHLQGLTTEVPRSPEVKAELIQTLLDLGRTDRAMVSLQVLDSIQVSECDHLSLHRRALAHAPELAFPLSQRLVRCGRADEAARYLFDQGRLSEAEAILESHPPTTEATRSLQARVKIGLGKLEDARELLAETPIQLSLDLNGAPLNPDGAAAILAWVKSNINNPDALAVLGTRSDWSPFGPLYYDTEAAIQRFEAEGRRSGRATRVLDHSILLFSPGGGSLRRVHEVLAISSRTAAEEFGELAFPDDAIPIAVYTRKADGQLSFAESIPEKDSLSLPDLEAGDYVVAMYLEPGDRGYLYDHGFLSQRVYFADLGINIFQQTFDVIPPAEPTPLIEVTPGISRRRFGSVGEQSILRFERLHTDAVPSEPRGLDPALYLPSLRVGGGVDLAESLRFARDRTLKARRADFAFVEFVRSIAQDKTGADLVRSLLSAVRNTYDDDADIFEAHVARGLTDGRGHRASALSAALEVAGVAHTLYLARPNYPRRPSPFIQVDDFEVPLIRVSDGTWIYPSHDAGPPGYLPFPMLGGEAIAIWPPNESMEVIKLPASRTHGDSRRSILRAKWTADGKIIGEVEDILTGQEAVSIAAYLRRLEPAQRPRLVERLLVHVLSTARVTSLEPPVLKANDSLVLRYSFEADVGERMDLGLFPLRPGHTFAALPERDTALYLDLPARHELNVSISSETPLFTASKTERARWGKHSFERRVEASPTALSISANLVVSGGLITPDRYPDFRAWAHAVNLLERVSVSRSASESSSITPGGVEMAEARR